MLDNRSTGNSEPSAPTTAAASHADQAVSASDAAIAALADRVAAARGKLPLQSDPALFAELSEAEISAERDLAEWMRKQRRQQRRRAVSAELASEKRDRRVALSVRRADDADARWHRRALAARRRVSNPDARLAQLYRRAEWSSRALIGVVVLGMLWAGVNVQHNLVPSGDMSDPLYWLSYGFEAMISIPIITIMVVATTAARWGREIARGKVVFLEVALLGVTIALNAGPHLVAGELARSAESAVAPVMVGVVIWLHSWVSARYAQLIDAIPVESDTTDDQPPRRSHTTVEFGAPRPATFPEFAPDPTDSVALPVGHTARPDTFLTDFDPAAGFFAASEMNTEPAQPNVAMPSSAQGVAAPVPQPAPGSVSAPSAIPQQAPAPAPIARDTIADATANVHDAAAATLTAERPATGAEATSNVRDVAAATLSAERPATGAEPTSNSRGMIADTAEPAPVAHATVPVNAPGRAPSTLVTEAPTDNTAQPSRPATPPVSTPESAEGTDSSDSTEQSAERAIQPPADTPSDATPANDSPKTTPADARPANRPAQHPAQRAAAMSEPTDSPRPAARAEQGTQLALDEQPTAATPTRRPRPRIVPVPEPEPPANHRDVTEAHDGWDDGDEIDPDSDETGVWAVAREISARRLSKLPVEQLAEVLTLADESWTPAAIGASIGLPGSRVLGILEAARRLARPYAVGS
ncbi:hypothetical protein [Nocardia macrotermitis]|uniref:Uncharacterized protein n=1 Tax=Nocardia macrotermitis TaxID=2585198 RepID=A0A7K0DBI6_9NOCA|nr:hypothetical protein [Nocardia macrotermitis]MQY23097.1 hypothetical protein [Nocardia macrotermitis]